MQEQIVKVVNKQIRSILIIKTFQDEPMDTLDANVHSAGIKKEHNVSLAFYTYRLFENYFIESTSNSLIFFIHFF